MFAGKTTQLINVYETYKLKGLDPIVIKPVIDDREGTFNGWGTTRSRLINKEIPAYYYRDIRELESLQYKTLFIDEAQFMTREDALYVAKLADKGIPVHAYGLKTDVNGELFEGTKALMALSDQLFEMENLCQINGCTNKAVAHARYINGVRVRTGDSVAIEKGNITYKAVCRKHWRE
jgi:thymidine kinase